MLKSMWLDTIKQTKYESLNKNIETEILVIGGGITGISCCYELSNYFSNITLVTMNEFFSGTTGFTTAKTTFQHGYIYHDLINMFGKLTTTQYYEFNKMGLERIKEIIELEKIDCDFKEVDSYLFNYLNEEDNIKNEFQAYQKIGIDGEMTNFKELDALAIKVSNQGQFHPLKYLQALLDKLKNKGVKIYENTKIIDINGHNAITENNYTISADNIIIATNYPIYPNFNMFFTKMIPSKSYVVVGKPNKDIQNGNYINTKEPYLSLRYHNDLLVVTGLSHDCKEMKNENQEFKKLTDIAKSKFEIEDFKFAWSTRDYDSVDLLPFIGKLSSFVYLSTAYGKWGMTNSVAGSVFIKDLILNNETKYETIFNPLRSVMNKKFFKYNAGMVGTIIKSKKQYEKHDDDLEQTEGKVVKFNSTRYGMYKDEDNNVYIVKATCTHLGCGLKYNKVDRTYDCPCHGSKFNYDGRVLAGPAKKDLKIIKIKHQEEKNG